MLIWKRVEKKVVSHAPEVDLNIDVKHRLDKLSLPHNIFNLIGLQVFQRAIRTLSLNDCNLGDGDVDSLFRDLPYLKELDLSKNNFSRLNFSVLQLPRLKWLNVSGCTSLVEILGIPSSIAVLIANCCIKLENVGDISNCKWLWKVTLWGENKLGLFGGDTLLHILLQGNAVEDHFISFTTDLKHQIQKGLLDKLARKKTFTLQLPHNWYNDFSGFLMCIVNKDNALDPCVKIIIKKETKNEDSQPAVFHEFNEAFDSDYDFRAYVGYVSFNSLKRDTEWLDLAYNTISISLDTEHGSWFVAELVPKKNKGDRVMQTTKVAADCFEYYDKEDRMLTKKFKIQHHSKSSINILWYSSWSS